MKTKVKLIVVVALISLLVGFVLQRHVDRLRAENQRLRINQERLLQAKEQLQNYKVLDSLNAVTIKALRLTIDEYKEADTKNLQLIKELTANKRDLQSVIDAQTQTVNDLTAALRDTVIRDTIIQAADTLKYFNYTSKWLDLTGHLNLVKNEIAIQSKSRESLKLVETVTYKRFLGFLWKTKQIKSRDLSIVSENPATTIINVDYSVIAE